MDIANMKNWCIQILFWISFPICIGCGIFAYNELVREYIDGQNSIKSIGTVYWICFNITTAWILYFNWEGSLWGKVTLYSKQFIMSELAFILPMVKLWFSIGYPFNNRNIPNMLVVTMPSILLFLYSMMNSANHLMLIYHIASNKTCDNILKRTNTLRISLLTICLAMIIVDLIIPIWQLDWTEFCAFHLSLIMLGKWCVLYSTEPSKQYFIAKGMKIFFGLEQRVIDTLVLMWLYAPPLRDIIVGTYLTLAYNKDGLKLIEDGIVFKRRENDEGFFYIIFIFFILAFSQVRDHLLFGKIRAECLKEGSLDEIIVEDTAIKFLPDYQLEHEEKLR